MTSNPLPRLLPLCGPALVAVVLITILVIAPSAPGPDASGADLSAFYDDNQGAQLVGVFAFAATAPLLVLFAAALAGRVVAGRERIAPWRHVILGGAVLTAGGILLAATAQLALVSAAEEDLSAGALEAVNAVSGATWVFFNTGFAVMTLGVAGALLAGRERRALGWAALVLGIALLIPFADFVALLITLAWIAVVGVVLARRPVDRPEPAIATAA